MADINTIFCRLLLASVHKAVKKFAPDTNLRADAWVWHFHRDSWEFHGPDKFYWNGRADNAYEARAKGWQAWIRSKQPEEV